MKEETEFETPEIDPMKTDVAIKLVDCYFRIKNPKMRETIETLTRTS